MLQETTNAAAATGGNAATALTQMGVDHLLGEMTSNPGTSGGRKVGGRVRVPVVFTPS